jgi:hypothetical protein
MLYKYIFVLLLMFTFKPTDFLYKKKKKKKLFDQ